MRSSRVCFGAYQCRHAAAERIGAGIAGDGAGAARRAARYCGQPDNDTGGVFAAVYIGGQPAGHGGLRKLCRQPYSRSWRFCRR